MADRCVCVKCESEVEITKDKILRCGTKWCNNVLHYVCSAFKPTELKFVEANRDVVWFCEGCLARHTSEQPGTAGGPSSSSLVSENVISTIQRVDQNFEMVVSLIKELELKIDKQNTIISKLELKLSEKQTKSEGYEEPVKPPLQETTAAVTIKRNRPITRSWSTTTPIDGDDRQQAVAAISKNTNTNNDKQQQSYSAVVGNKKTNTDMAKGIAPPAGDTRSTDGFTDVKHKRRKMIRGSRTENASISAVESRKWIFVSRLQKHTTEEDLKSYLTENNIEIISCDKLVIRSDQIAAFKIGIPASLEENIYRSDLWPINTIVRPYINFRKTQVVEVTK